MCTDTFAMLNAMCGTPRYAAPRYVSFGKAVHRTFLGPAAVEEDDDPEALLPWCFLFSFSPSNQASTSSFNKLYFLIFWSRSLLS